uniref:Uncharacterized protein n=1 Tax=Otus sunia TaxID=257818 RepID=A0A8C8AHJ9_9STRI
AEPGSPPGPPRHAGGDEAPSPCRGGGGGGWTGRPLPGTGSPSHSHHSCHRGSSGAAAALGAWGRAGL